MSEQDINIFSGKVLDCCIEVHRYLGPGLLESIYETCLCKEFDLRKITYQKQIKIPIKYKGDFLNSHLKLDVLVESEIVLELKSVENMLPLYSA